jgi:regulator of nonsense transcripts 1
VTWFVLPKLESGEVRLAAGDELQLRYTGELREGVDHVIKVPNSMTLYLIVQLVLMIHPRCLGRDMSRAA